MTDYLYLLILDTESNTILLSEKLQEQLNHCFLCFLNFYLNVRLENDVSWRWEALLQIEIGYKKFPGDHNMKHFDQVFDQGLRDYFEDTQ